MNVEPEAGNHMFVSGWDGKLYRFDGMEAIYSQDDVPANMGKQIRSVGAAITGVSVDPNNPNHVVISVGGYGAMTSGKVQETFNALDDSAIVVEHLECVRIWASMPCYDVIIDAMDPSGRDDSRGYRVRQFLQLTTAEMTGLWRIKTWRRHQSQITAPVFDVKQQWRGVAPWINPSNQGAIYAATHGRGIFRSDLFLGVDEPSELTVEAVESLLVYPNPVSEGTFSVQSETFRGDFQLQVFDITGRLNVDRAIRGYAGGPIVVDASGLENGQYIVRLTNGTFQKTAKLLVR